MKKFTFLFATLLAMFGDAFGQVLSKVLWETNISSKLNIAFFDEQYDIYNSKQGNSMIKRRYNITGRTGHTFSDIELKTFDKNGKLLLTSENLYKNRSQGGGISTINNFKNYSFVYGSKSIFTSNVDSMFLLNQEFQLQKGFLKKDVDNYPIPVDDGFVRSYPKSVIKYDFRGNEEWRYESQENIELINRKAPYLCAVRNGDNKFDVLILDKKGKEKRILEKSDDGTFFEINDSSFVIWYTSTTNPENSNISKYDTTGKLLMKISTKGFSPYSITQVPVKILSDNSMIITYYDESKEISFAKIDNNGKIIEKQKTGIFAGSVGFERIFPFFETRVTTNYVSYYAFSVDTLNKGVSCKIGAVNFDDTSKSWQKKRLYPYESLRNVITPPVSLEANNTIFQAYPSTEKPSELTFTTYNSKGDITWNSPFTNKTILLSAWT